MDNLKTAVNSIYGTDPDLAEKQWKRFQRLADDFRRRFGRAPGHLASTPGRTELGGNHTDHNHGRVLAASVDLDSIALAATNNTSQVTIHSEGYAQPFSVELKELKPVKKEAGTTQALIRGMAAALKAKGYEIGGFDACMTSSVLPGSGLSSSASIEVLIGTIFNALYNDGIIEPETLAASGQFAENNYFGKPCGLMDQLACAVGGIVAIDFADPARPEIDRVDFDLESHEFSLLVVDTRGNHTDLTDEYAAIPGEMKAVAAELGGQVMRDVCPDDFMKKIALLRDRLGDRPVLRALHFLRENERVVRQVKALRANDLPAFLKLVRESGNSSFKLLQNIFSAKDVRNQSVTLALLLSERYLQQGGAGVCRVHGGGFAGTIQVLIPGKMLSGYRKYMEKIFGPGCVLPLKIRHFGTMHRKIDS